MNLNLEFERRSGGAVKRWHAWPIIGEQTVAAHSWGVARILMFLYEGDPSLPVLLMHAINHDLVEVRTGDMPAHVKWQHPDLAAIQKRVEAIQEDELGTAVDLDAREYAMFKIADWTEMMFFSIEQAHLGSHGMDEVMRKLSIHFSQKTLSPREHDFIATLQIKYQEIRHDIHHDHA